MRRVGTIWLPDADNYFDSFFENGEGFQLDRLEAALSHVRDFDIAIDGGAHVGSWSIAMSERFKKVISFEPAADTYECLTRNTFVYTNVDCYKKALGDIPTFVKSVDDKTRLGNTGSRFVEKGDGNVEMITIDSLNLSTLGFLKLDLEGAELIALKGATKTLLKFKPVVFVEAKKGMAERFGGTTGDCLTYLKELGMHQVARISSDYVFTF